MVRWSITFPSQCRELTLMRQDDQVWAGEHRCPAVATLKRLDLALQAFFRRVKAGAAVTLTAAMLAIPTMAKSRTPVALLLVRPTNRMVRMVANPAPANGQIPVVSRPSTEKATRTSSALLHPHPMAGGCPHRPPPGGRPQGTRSAGCRTNPRLSPPPGHTGSSPLPCQALAYAPTLLGNRVKELVDDLPFFHDTLA